MNKFIEMRRQLSKSPTGATLCEWLEQKIEKYCDVRNLQSNEDLNSAKHVCRVLEEIIKELQVASADTIVETNEYV